ncbi:MAG: protein kinase [Alphaproteobacteria bacterium]|nr:protein kinase [Alphaproteobacteria bacterium]MCB9695497.1 protein kinase [Alphaproteobacteria bacterium]
MVPEPEVEAADTDRFEVRSRLGSGASGVVYAAWDRRRRVPVALKTLRRMDPEGVFRLKQEFRARADVAHPNLVSLFELLQTGDQCLLSMELVDGVPFMDWVRGGGGDRPSVFARSSTSQTHSHPPAPLAFPDTTTFDDSVIQLGPIDPERVAMGVAESPLPTWEREERPEIRVPEDLGRLREAFRQLSEGVDALHRARRLHRDLKPANVLVTAEGRVVLVDFGLTEDLSAVKRERRVAGTAAYMSPEQAAGDTLTEAADWYAVGVMLFEALTGQRPFMGSMNLVLAEKQAYDAPAPSELCPGVPEDLDRICVSLLARDPAARPSGSDVLAVFGAARPTPVSTPRVLVGRGVHLASLHRAFKRARSGSPVVAWLRGPSGMGKSYLLQRLRDELAAEGHEVLRGRCFERETVAFNVFDAMIEELAARPDLDDLVPVDVGALLRLFPQLGRAPCLANEPPLQLADPQLVRERAFRAFVELVGAMAPVALLLDDVQWGDADSVRLLGALLQARAPILVVLAHRSEEEHAPFLVEARRLVAQGVTERTVDVAELAPREALDLALLALRDEGDDALPGPDRTELASRIAAESGGNPFFVEELCRFVLRHGEVRGLALDDAIRDRVASLPASSREVLELMALAGRPVAPLLLERTAVAELLLPELDLLRSSRLIRTAPDRVETAHDRIREAVTRGLDATTLRARHRTLAEAFEPDHDADALVTHWEGAGEHGRAADWARTAATEAEAMLAFDRAARRWADTLRLSEPAGSARASVLERMGTALRNAARGMEAGRAFREGAACVEGEARAELVRRSADALLDAGYADEGVAAANEALAPYGLVVHADPRRALPGLLWERLRLGLRGVTPAAPAPLSESERARLSVLNTVGRGISWLDFVQGELFLARYARAALDSGDPREVVRGLCALWVGRASGTASDRAAMPELEARATALVGEDPELRFDVATARALVAFFHGEFEDQVRLAQEGTAIADQLVGVDQHRTSLRLVLLWGLLFRGLLGEIQEVLPGELREARDRGNLRFVATATTEVQSVLLLAQDRPDDAVAEVVSMERWKRPDRFTLQQQSEMLAYGWIDAYVGEGDRAHRRLEATWPALNRSLLLHHRFVRLEAHLLRARCALGAAAASPDRRLLTLAERSLNAARKDPSPWSEAQRIAVTGTWWRAKGQPERAVEAWREAAHQLEVTGQLLQAAGVRHRLGRVLGGDEGAALVRAAEDWMKGQGVVDPEGMVRMVMGTP